MGWRAGRLQAILGTGAFLSRVENQFLLVVNGDCAGIKIFTMACHISIS